MMIALFVYCKTMVDDRTMRQALDDLGSRLVAAGWPAATLWRRPARPDQPRRTWMATYPPLSASQAEALEAAIDEAARACGLSGLIDGGLHVERFSPQH